MNKKAISDAPEQTVNSNNSKFWALDAAQNILQTLKEIETRYNRDLGLQMSQASHGGCIINTNLPVGTDGTLLSVFVSFSNENLFPKADDYTERLHNNVITPVKLGAPLVSVLTGPGFTAPERRNIKFSFQDDIIHVQTIVEKAINNPVRRPVSTKSGPNQIRNSSLEELEKNNAVAKEALAAEERMNLIAKDVESFIESLAYYAPNEETKPLITSKDVAPALGLLRGIIFGTNIMNKNGEGGTPSSMARAAVRRAPPAQIVITLRTAFVETDEKTAEASEMKRTICVVKGQISGKRPTHTYVIWQLRSIETTDGWNQFTAKIKELAGNAGLLVRAEAPKRHAPETTALPSLTSPKL